MTIKFQSAWRPPYRLLTLHGKKEMSITIFRSAHRAIVSRITFCLMYVFTRTLSWNCLWVQSMPSSTCSSPIDWIMTRSVNRDACEHGTSPKTLTPSRTQLQCYTRSDCFLLFSSECLSAPLRFTAKHVFIMTPPTYPHSNVHIPWLTQVSHRWWRHSTAIIQK